jgi:tRNA dimethylallyltransferase
MHASRKSPALVAVVGPTGSGKSDLALAIAERFGGEVVNCDSLQIYRYFDIGAAKLSIGDRRDVPHHLLDAADPDEQFSAGEYARRARRILAEITARGRLPVVAGGTGLYLRALLDGLFAGPSRDEALRTGLLDREAARPGCLHRLLRRLDPLAAGRIHRRDLRKLVRALEVCLITRGSLSAAFAGGREALQGYSVLKIGLDPPRDALYERLDLRCRRMFEQGLVDEVRRILLLGFSPAVKPLESHGYKQALQILRRELPWEEAVWYAQRNTRHYAKRQCTWFRKEEGVEWQRGFGDDPSAQESVLQRVEAHLTDRSARLG